MTGSRHLLAGGLAASDPLGNGEVWHHLAVPCAAPSPTPCEKKWFDLSCVHHSGRSYALDQRRMQSARTPMLDRSRSVETVVDLQLLAH